jgi:hypothetical protein
MEVPPLWWKKSRAYAIILQQRDHESKDALDVQKPRENKYIVSWSDVGSREDTHIRLLLCRQQAPGQEESLRGSPQF